LKQPQNNSSDLLSELKSAVDYLGIDETINVLRKEVNSKLRNTPVDVVMSEVCKTVGITQEEFMDSKLMSYERKVAIGFCSYLLNEFFDYSKTKISLELPLNLHRRTITVYHSIILKAKLKNPKSEIDILVSTHFDNLNNIITQHKNKLQNGQTYRN
jgi:hypothetical protein